METFGIDKPFCDIVASDELGDIWESDLDPVSHIFYAIIFELTMQFTEKSPIIATISVNN